MKCDTHDGNSIFVVDSASYPISLMLHDCITYDINMTLLWWMGVAKSIYQFIITWGYLSVVTPWFVSNIDNTSIRLWMSLKRIFKGFWPQVQNTYFVEHFSMVAYDNILEEKQNVIFRQTLIPVYALVYFPFEILSNENFFKQFLSNSLLPNCKEGY